MKLATFVVPVTDNRPNKAWCATGEVEIFGQGDV
jgi:hypothetical protein